MHFDADERIWSLSPKQLAMASEGLSGMHIRNDALIYGRPFLRRIRLLQTERISADDVPVA